MIKILSYNYTHQNGIDDLMNGIALEFSNNIFPKPTIDTPMIPDMYWVALNGNEVIGTIGILRFRNSFVVLKKMMLKKEWRSKSLGVSKALLETAIEWCEVHKISKIYLGTMSQFIAAQSFYINNGFIEISEYDLPSDFLKNPLDTVFFVRDLIILSDSF